MYDLATVQHRIRLSVTGAHLALVLFFALTGWFEWARRPRLEVMRVNLLMAPPQRAAAPAQSPPAPAAAPSDPAPASPPEPVPPPPEPARAKPPRWVPRTAADIRRTAKLRPAATGTARPPAPRVNPAEIERTLGRAVPSLNITPASTNSTWTGGAAADRYYAAVSAALRAQWNQPSRAAVGAAQPVVTVSITVFADGRIARASLSRPSASQAMNASVARVLKALSRLPAPKDYGIKAATFAFSVEFGLSER